MKKLIILLVALMLIAPAALADKQWVEMTVVDVESNTFPTRTAKTLENYGKDQKFVFRVEPTPNAYGVSFATKKGHAWHGLTINNNGVSSGLTFYLCDRNGNVVTNFGYIYEGDTTLNLRLDPGTDYALVFGSHMSMAGTVTFELVALDDAAGEDLFNAGASASGTVTAETIAVPEDEDWFLLPARLQDGEMTLHIENSSSAPLDVMLQDEFDEELISTVCQPSDRLELKQPTEAGVGYYVCIRQAYFDAANSYTFAWCDGAHHTLGAMGVAVQATCAQAGSYGRTCEICGTVVESESIPQLSHTPGSFVDEEPPTCVSDGKSRMRCTLCNTVMNENPLPATGHSYGPWTETLAPTRDAEGQESQSCLNCGDTITQPVPKLTFWQSIFGR